MIDQIPDWGKMLGSIGGALGVRELVANWQRQRYKNQDSDHDRIKQLEAENAELKGKISQLEVALARIEGVLEALGELVDDDTVRAALNKINNG